MILRSVCDGPMSVGHWWNDINSGNRCTQRNKTVPVSLRLLQTSHTDWPGIQPTPLQRLTSSTKVWPVSLPEKLAVDRSQVHGNYLVGQTWKRRANYETWKLKSINPVREVPVMNLDQKTGCREIFRDFLGTSGQMPGQCLKFGDCQLSSSSFLYHYWLTSSSFGAT